MKIVISGERGEGKSTLSKYLYQLLCSLGHVVEVPVEQGVPKQSQKQIERWCNDTLMASVPHLSPMHITIEVENE